jgi:UDP-3-O-[3-hydroxymyristoyl] glucosamine N-acyltransferase
MKSADVVGDARFFANTGPHSLGSIALALGCATPAGDRMIAGLASLEAAGPEQISFLANPKHLALLDRTRAGAVLVTQPWQDRVPAGAAGFVIDDPAASWRVLAEFFHPATQLAAGAHPSAVIAASASIDPSAQIGANAVIGERTEIGADCTIGPGAVIGDGVVLGPGCRVGANASISHATLGARVTIYPGARIGQEGFGFVIAATGFVTTPQLGRVIIGDDVEIGANSAVDRGALRDTIIGTGTRIDNLVQVAHGVRIGRWCAIAAHAGISGSAEIEDFVVIGGQVGVAEHVRIGAKTRIGAQTGVISDLDPGSVVVGSPARPARDFFREVAILKKIAAKK